MSSDLKFAPDQEMSPVLPGHKILVVDDDREVHAVTRLMLADYRYKGHGVELIHANSAAEARKLLAEDQAGIALVLLDVVMETDRSGLELVRYIRSELRNSGIRIVLRTGQPGQTPEHQIVSQYAIDDYVLKSELTYLRVQTLVTTALRTFELVRSLEHSQKQLRDANRELERLSQTDPLTGLWNRRRFDQELKREWRRLIRDKEPLSVLMLDVDSFKAYNDTLGHPAGDRVLKYVGATLEEIFRRGADMVCRFGGEEFLAALPGTDLHEALGVAETARARIEALGLPHPRSAHGVVTVSIGCSGALPDRNRMPGPGVLIEQADRALYDAKAAGRNRVASEGDRRLRS